MPVPSAWARSGRGPIQSSMMATETTPPAPRPSPIRAAAAPGPTGFRSSPRLWMRSSVFIDHTSVLGPQRLQAAVDGDLHRRLGHAVLFGGLAHGKARDAHVADQRLGALGELG